VSLKKRAIKPCGLLVAAFDVEVSVMGDPKWL